MKRTFVPVLAGSLALALAGCGAQNAVTDAASTAAGETGASATAESGDAGDASSITLYTSEPQAKIDELVAAFNEDNPDIEVEVFRAGTGDLTTRIDSEIAGGGVQADVLLAADAPTFEKYVADDLLSPLDVETDALLPEVVDPEGYYVGTRVIPTVIAYNTGEITEPPASWQALTDARYADKIVMPDPDVSGAAAFNAAVWFLNPDLGPSWFESLGANRPVIAESNGPVSQAVAAGTQPVGIVVDYLVRDLAAEGSPIAASYPSEGVPYVFQPAGIFADSDATEAATTFVSWLVSKEGQELAVEQNYLPVREDVGTPDGAPAMDELTLMDVDLDEVDQSRTTAIETFNSTLR